VKETISMNAYRINNDSSLFSKITRSWQRGRPEHVLYTDISDYYFSYLQFVKVGKKLNIEVICKKSIARKTRERRNASISHTF